MQIRYTGPFAAVEIAATGQVVKHGSTVDIDDKTVADALLTQPDTWKAVKSSSSKTPKKNTPPSKEK